jgi:chromosome partitioning protein
MHLAAYLQQDGKTVLLDGDLNRSATAWSARSGGKLPFDIVDEQSSFAANDYRHFVIDTAARPAPNILKGLSDKVDLIIIPTTADGLSLDALSKTVDALREVRVEKFRILLTMIPPRPSRDGELARAAFEQVSLPMFSGSIRNLKAFKTAGTQGILVSDVKDPRAQLGWEDYADVGAEMKVFSKAARVT